MRCLALNASFEPLTMVPVRRALRLVIEGKAEIVEADGPEVVRSERLAIPRPAIIRLVKFVHVPRRFRRHVRNKPGNPAPACSPAALPVGSIPAILSAPRAAIQ